jgi:peptide/nickel transport system substrate-binding protein
VLNTTAGPNGQAIYLIYEPLLQFDTASTVVYPWLATSYSWSAAGKTLTFELRQGVKWSNGTPFTSADVVYTFDALKKEPALNETGVTFGSVTANGPYKVTLTFPSPQYVNLYYIAQTLIVPAQIWSKIPDGKLATYADTDPIGTGPYLVKSISLPTVTMTRNVNYWGGEAKVPTIYITGYKSNTADEDGLLSGSVEWNGSTIIDVQRIYVDKDSSTNHTSAVPSGVISLEPNLTVYPLGMLDVRKAISLAISRSLVSSEGESGASPPVENQAAVILPIDKADLDPSLAQPYPSNVAEAKSLLSAAGLTKNSGGQLIGKGGKPIDLTILDPSSYTDYITDAQVIASELKPLGFNVTVVSDSVGAWGSAIGDGDFDMAVRYSVGGPEAYFDYDGWLDSSLSAPIGHEADEDFERYSSVATQTLLADARNYPPTSTQGIHALYGLEEVIANDLPVIPLVYNEEHGNYSTQSYVGWPSSSDQYAAATTQNPSFEIVVLHLRPAG